MKLIILMCIEEYTRDVRKILLNHQVPIFSETEISGYRIDKGQEEPSWFSGPENGGIYSHLFFSFLDPLKSEELMEAVKDYNTEHTDLHPLRAFLLDVEEFV